MIEWKEKYSVNVEKIDNQHKTFFGLLNKLENLTGHKTFLEELPLILNEIVEYTALHFTTEEKYLEEVNYPNIEEHRIKHNQMKKEVYLKCKQVIEKEPTTMDIIWLYNFMKDWLQNHILEEDSQYCSYVEGTN